ncbi:bis(5'-nucleosyl)-tetraphosphatase (symmetrical) YqeK [Virgibacillus natechei]|uniref:bis(5'-nucleosyl)-tetraphosphatase (symmetrical) YqeK n=1 Tax=Virgibacillus sp. CBA3643 TaxID=2942278 RepID=UPI0035A332E0
MKIDEAVSLVKPHLTKERFDHTLRVAETAVILADLYHEPKKEVELAAIFHDHAKQRPLDELKRWIERTHLPKDLLHYHHELWHGPVGAILVEREFGIKNSGIQHAIYYHTTGRAYMSKIEMIIYLADYIEPGRSFPGIDEVREMAKEDLKRACWMATRNSIYYLMQKNATIYPDTFHAYNDLTRHLDGGNA